MTAEKKPKRCPFCYGNGHVSIRQMKFYGWNALSDRKIKYGAQVICGRCHARGPLYSRDIIIGARDGKDKNEGKQWLRDAAIYGWNKRFFEEVQG